MDSKACGQEEKSIMDGILKKGLGIVYNSKCKTDARWTAAAETVPGPDVRQTWETNSIAEATSRGGGEVEKEAEKPMSLANLNHDSAMVGPGFSREPELKLGGGTESQFK